MDELQKLIEKWDEQIALHRRVCDDPLMYTKEDRLQNSHYAQAICAVVADLKKLSLSGVSFELPSDDIFDISEVSLNNPLEEFYYYERPAYLEDDQKEFRERLQKALNYLKG